VALSFGSVVLNLDTRQLLRDGVEVHLSPKAFQLLAILAERRPAALSKAALLEHLWPATFVAEANLPNLVGEIRAAIGDDPRSPTFIRTVSRFGYAFSAEAAGPAPSAREATHEFKLAREGRQQLLDEGENVIGRTTHAGSWFDSISVSRRHARIVVHGDSATVEDLGSKNGTYVDEERIAVVTPLASGARIRFGSVAVTFRIDVLDDTTKTSAE
jgi:DNA-binding winged helix-turn-helix (wHTH) protein